MKEVIAHIQKQPLFAIDLIDQMITAIRRSEADGTDPKLSVIHPKLTKNHLEWLTANGFTVNFNEELGEYEIEWN